MTQPKYYQLPCAVLYMNVERCNPSTRYCTKIALGIPCCRYGRRPMSLLSGVGMTVCMIGLAVYLQLVPNGSQIALDNSHLSIIPLILLLVYVVRALQ